MSATRNPYYQLPGGTELPGDVRVSDTADPTKTAAGGWAASPAALASVVTSLSSLICDFSIGDNSAHFKCRLDINELRSSFVLISIGQSSGICLNSLVVRIKDGSNASTELWHNDLSISNIVTSKSGDIFTIDITYDRSSIWGELFIIPSRNIPSIYQ